MVSCFQSKWTPEQMQFVAAFRETGITYKQITELADRWGKHKDTVLYQVKQQGIPFKKRYRSFHREEIELIRKEVPNLTANYSALMEALNNLAKQKGWEPPSKKAVYSKVASIRRFIDGWERLKAENVPKKDYPRPRFKDPISISEISGQLKISEKIIWDWLNLCPEIIRLGFLNGEKVISQKSFKDFALQYPGEIEKAIPGSFGLLSLLNCRS